MNTLQILTLMGLSAVAFTAQGTAAAVAAPTKAATKNPSFVAVVERYVHAQALFDAELAKYNLNGQTKEGEKRLSAKLRIALPKL